MIDSTGDDGLPRIFDDDRTATDDAADVVSLAMDQRVYSELPDDPAELIKHCDDQLGIQLDDRHRRGAVRAFRDALKKDDRHRHLHHPHG